MTIRKILGSVFIGMFLASASFAADGDPVREGKDITGTLNLTSGSITGDLIPDTDDTYDLGSTTKEWKDLWVDGTAHADTIDADAVDITSITDNNIPKMGASGFEDSAISDDGSGNVAVQSGTDATTGFQVKDADGGTPVLNVDTDNERTGFNTASPQSQVDVTQTAIGVTPLDTNGIRISNTTDAAAGAQQYSPPLVMQGQGWKTNATAASQKVEFMQDVRPVQGAAAPTGYWGIYPSIADGAYSATPVLSAVSNGFVDVAGQVRITKSGGQLRLLYDSTHFTDFGTASNGDFYVYSFDSGGGGYKNILLGTDIGTATQSNVGIGTTAPQSLLDVQGPAGTGTATAGIATLATKETTIVATDELGRINFNAPLEADGTDAILPGASIWAVAEGTFAADSNATSLVFATGSSEAAAEKMRITSAGLTQFGTASGAGQVNVTPSTSIIALNVQGGQIAKVTTVNAATYDLLITDYILNVTYTATAAVTSLTLPTAQCVAGRIITIKDAGGGAGANTITIDTEGAETIDGAATFVLNTNYEAIDLYSDGSNWFAR